MTLSRPQRACIVRESIAKGYGVEDIALMYRLPADEVRAEVVELREIGAFKCLLSGSKTLQTPVKYETKTKRAEVATNELSALDITHLVKETRNAL